MARREKVSSKARLILSNPDKVLNPASHFTKARAIDYYPGVARFLLKPLNSDFPAVVLESL